MISEIDNEYMKRAKNQETGPFGQYKMPDMPRFKFDPELSRAVSIVPDLEIVSEYGSPGGGGGGCLHRYIVQGSEILPVFILVL